MRTRTMQFDAELIAGPEGAAFLVPFDPAQTWEARAETVRIAGARVRSAHPVAGSVAGRAFEGWIGRRWGRCWLPIDEPFRAAAGLEVGRTYTVIVDRKPSRDGQSAAEQPQPPAQPC